MNKPFQGRGIADQTAIGAAFLIAGMHRSGTSAMARVVSILGAELPRTLMQPAADNPKGFWESALIAQLNDELLEEFGSSWDDVLAFLARRDELRTRTLVLEKVSAVLSAEYALNAPIVIKEPRIALLLDLWITAVTRERFAPRVIIPIRDPLEVCASLRARSGFSDGRSLLLWLSYFLAAEKSSRGTRRVFVRYTDLLEDWRGVMRRTEERLDVRFVGWTPAAELEVDGFLSREDRHQRLPTDLLDTRADVVDWVKQAYAWANLAATSETEPDSQRLDAIAEAFEASVRVFAPVIAEERAVVKSLRQAESVEREGRLGAEETARRIAHEAGLATTQRDAALAHGQEQEARATALDADVRDREVHIYTLEGDLRDRTERLDALRQDVHALEIKLTETAEVLRQRDERERDLQQKLVRLTSSEATLSAQVVALEARREEAASARQAAEHQQAKLEQDIAARDEALGQAEAALGSRADQIKALEQSVTSRDTRLRALEAETREQKQRTETLERQLADRDLRLRDETRALEAKAAGLHAQIAKLTTHLQARDQSEAGLRAALAEREREYAVQAEHVLALEESVRAASEKAHAEGVLRQHFEALSATQSAFIARSITFVSRVRRGLWRRPVLRWASDLLEALRLTLSRGPLAALRVLHVARTLRSSGEFDAAYYLQNGWDVAAIGQDPTIHYAAAGASEGRDPSPHFSTRGYQQRYPDIARARSNPLFHYVRYGRQEGRSAPPVAALEQEPAAAVVEALQPSAPPAVDPYSVRPDDSVAIEAAKGAAFMARFALHSEAPDWAGAVAEINAAGAAPPASPHVSVIVPTYGQLAYTLNCIHSLVGHQSKHRFEILIVDDCSPDASREWVGRVRGVRLHARAANGGFIEACNDGAQQARGEWLVLLNNDTRVVPGWLDSMIESFSTLPDAELVGSKLFYPDGSLQEAGGIIWQDGSAWNYGRNDDPGRPEYCYARPVDYVSGASIAIAKRVWNEIGGFDLKYKPAYCEDADLALKIRYKRKKQVWMQPLSRVIHYEGKTSGVDVKQGVKAYQVQNTQLLYERWRAELSGHRRNADAPLIEKDRGVTKRALVLDATTPEPNKDAGSVTCVALMRALQAAGYKVTFAAEDNLLFLPHASQPLQALGIEVLYAPYNMTVDAALEMHGRDYDLALVFRFGVVGKHLESFRQRCPNMPVIMHCSDLHFLREERHAQLLNDPQKIAAAAATRARELDVIKAVDATIVHSPVEKDVIAASVPGARVFVFPYIQNAEPRTTGFRERRDVAFLGGYRHTPNVDAVMYFAERIWPKVHAARPGMRFLVAGSECPKELLDLHGRNGVHVTGFVEDLKEFFAGVRLSIAPIRYGAGIKGKVAVALGHGLPTVLTSCAAEGMGLIDGEAVLIRDDEAEFARAIIELYDDERRWTAMSDRALEFVDNTYGAQLTKRRLEELLDLAGVGRPR